LRKTRMTLSEQVRLLSAVDILEVLSQEELEEIGQRSPDVYLEAGHIFLAPWDVGDRLFVLKWGRVQLYTVTDEGEEIMLSVVEGGKVFGEMALTGQSLAGVYARAVEPSVVCSLKRRDLERIILSHPEVGLRLVRHLSRLLQEAEIRIAELVHKSVVERLASHILRLAEREGIETEEAIMLPTRYTHEQLGSMIGSKRVAVTRAFNLLRQKRALELKQRHIYIKDKEALERIADPRR